MPARNVLLVEDDAAHAELVVRAFENCPTRSKVTVVRDLEQARQSVLNQRPDVAVVDFVLPDGKGIELVVAPEGIEPFPIVILTEYGDEREAVESLKAGVMDYVIKSESAFAEVPHFVDAALREWRHLQERNTAHRALLVSEERFRNLIEGSIQGIIISRGWKPLFVNQAYADILGYDSPEEILALESDEATFAPYERERIRSFSQARLEGSRGAPTHYEYDAVRRDGTVVALQNVARVVFWDGEPAVQSVVLDISDRRRAETALQYRVQLEQLITGISARFINLTSEEMDDAIADALQEVGEFSQVDRSYVVLFSRDYHRVTNQYEWCAPGVAPIRDRLQDAPVETLPWVTNRHRQGEIVYVPSVGDLPEAAATDKRRFDELGIKSLITLPLICRGEVLGFLGFDSVREEKSFSEDVISILTIVGESFGNAIARKTFEQSLRDSEERFKDFADIAADWFWELDENLRFSYLSERYQDVIGVPPGTHLGMTCEEIFENHVDDEQAWRKLLDDLVSHRDVESELTWLRYDRTSRVIAHVGRPRFNDSGEFLGYRGVGRDITEAHRLTEQIAHQASHDALTGLVNRREFESRLERAVKNAQENGVQYVLGYIDLDRFKLVNDMAGHAAGDVLLKRVASILVSKIRGRDTLARLGGDEFSLLLENCPLEKALQIADSMIAGISGSRFTWEGRTFEVGLSVGLISVTVHAESSTRMLAQADMACYTAKRLGTNRVHVYEMEDRELLRRQTDIRRAGDLRDALENDRLCLFGQPIVALSPDVESPLHIEVLLRLVSDDGSLISPDQFIPAAERYGLMVPIDRWVIKTALDYSSALGDRSPGIAINLSGNSVNDESLLDFVTQTLRTSGVPPSSVCFEITETAAIHNFDKANHFIKRMKTLGCRFALDDFGSGVSSFKYLKHLAVDYLKIDGGFVQNMAVEPVDRAMVGAIHEVGRIMGIKTIAERADTEEAVEQLRELGIDYVQGDAVGEAIPLNEIDLRDGQPGRVHMTH